MKRRSGVKKRIVAVILVVCVMSVLMPTITLAAVVPYFMAVNDTLLPFSYENMPYVTGGELYVPHGIFSGVYVWSVASAEQVRIYTGADRFVDFYTASGVVEDQNGNILSWSPARRVGNRYYVPLQQVCDFFGLTYEIFDIGRDIIPQEQMRVIRIKAEGYIGLNVATFIGIHRDALKASYDEYYAPSTASPGASPPSPPATSPGETTPPPTEEPPPKYNDVTIYHSFYNISDGGVKAILELLDAGAAPDSRACFFVSADDIRENIGLIRSISSSGHAIGIWLEKGTYDEYVETSALLFEAAKIKTVLVSADSKAEAQFEKSDKHEVIFWRISRSLAYDDTFSVDTVTDMLPQDSGARRNLMASCSEFTALMLSGILSYLRENEYSVMRITETVAPM